MCSSECSTPQSLFFSTFPNFRTFTAHSALCNKLHGKSTVVTDLKLQEELIEKAIAEEEACACKYSAGLQVLILYYCSAYQYYGVVSIFH